MIKHFLICPFLFLSIILFAQPKRWANLSISARSGYGFIASHKTFTRHIAEAHFTAQEVTLSVSQDHTNWAQTFNSPELGLTLWYSALGQSQLTGNAIGVFPNILFPLNKQAAIKHQLRLGFGIGYIQHPFNKNDNYKNILIGSKINHCANLLYELNIPVKRFNILTGISFTHFSNGSIKKPNLGINIPMLHLGVTFNQKPCDSTINAYRVINYKPWSLTLAGGVNDLSIVDSSTYAAFSFSTDYHTKITKNTRLGVGLVLFYNDATSTKLSNLGIDYSHKFTLIRPGIFGSYELMMNHFSALFQMGMYVYTKDKSEGAIFNRLVWRIHATDKLLINISLKSHFAKAEYIEFGIGYKL